MLCLFSHHLHAIADLRVQQSAQTANRFSSRTNKALCHKTALPRLCKGRNDPVWRRTRQSLSTKAMSCGLALHS